MKKLKKLSLDHLSEVVLNERKMGQILGGEGGYICQCGCNYEGQPGGSSTSSNSSANDADNLHSDDCSQPEPGQGLLCELPPQDCGEIVSSLCPHGSNSCWF